MEDETSSLKQSLQGMLNSVKADDEALGDFREVRLLLTGQRIRECLWGWDGGDMRSNDMMVL